MAKENSNNNSDNMIVFDNIIQRTNLSIAILDMDFNTIFLNNFFIKTFEYGIEDLSNQPISNIFVQTDSKLFENNIPKFDSNNPEPFTFDATCITKNKKLIFANINISIYNDENNGNYYLATFVSIDNNLDFNSSKDLISNKYMTLFDNLVSGFALLRLVYDAKDNTKKLIFTDVNKAYCNIMMRSRDELINKPIDVVYTDIEPYIYSKLFEIVNKNKNFNYEEWIYNDTKCVNVQLFSPQQNILGIFLEDITDKKRMTEQLLISLEKNRAVMEALPDILIILDFDGVVLSYQTANVSSLYISPDQFINKNLREILPAKVYREYNKSFQLALATKEIQSFTYKLDMPIGEVYYEARINIYFDQVLVLIRDINESFRTHKEIENYKINFETFFNSIDDLLFVIDLDGRIEYFNDTVPYRLEYTAEEIEKLNIITLADNTFLRSIIEEKQNYMNFPVHEFTLNFTSKMKFNIPTYTKLYQGLWNGKSRLFLVSKDLTDLVISQEKFSKAFLNHSSMMLMTDYESGEILEVNNTFIKTMGYSKSELIGNTTLEIGIYKDPDSRTYIINKIQKYGRLNDYETWLKTKSGQFIYCHYSINEIRIGDQRLLLSTMTDLTEKKLTEDRIAVLSMAIEQNPLPVVITGMNGNIEYVNKKFCQVSGYSIDELIGVNPRLLKTSIHGNEFYEDMWKTISSGLLWKGEIFNKKKNDETFWDNVVIFPISDSDGNILKFISIHEDITKQKLASELLVESEFKLRQSILEKDKFFSIIAHDLKTPLGGFIGLTSVLSKDLYNLKLIEMEELVSSMNESATNLFKLLENLLQWSKIQQNLIPHIPDMFSIGQIIKFNIELIHDSIRQKNITLQFNPKEEVIVKADIEMVNTILRNLLSNAKKFTHRNGKITIDYKIINQDEVLVSVEDTGIGLSEKDKENLFALTNKTSNPGTDGEPSTGLGLLLCKEFCEKNGGKIWVESEIGKGSKFMFTIPLSKDEEVFED